MSLKFGFQKIAFILSLCLLAFILYFVDWTLTAEKLIRLGLYEILILLAIQFLIVFFRSVRFGVVLPGIIYGRLYALFNLTVLHNFYLTVLPARLGDVYFASLSRQCLGISKSVGLSGLIVARIYDVIFLGLLIVVIVPFTNVQELNQSIQYFAFIAVAGMLMLFKFSKIMKLIVALASYLKKITGKIIFDELANSLLMATQELDSNMNTMTHIKGFISTIVSWLALMALYWYVLYVFDIPDAFLVAVLLVALSNVVLLIPIHSVGGLGVIEAAFTYGLVLKGLEFTEAVTVAVSMSIVLLLVTVVFACAWYVINLMLKKVLICN